MLKEPDYRKSTERLLILWLVSFFVGGFSWQILRIVLQISTGVLSLDHLVITLLLVFYFLPLLFKLHKTAKLAKMNAIKNLALVVIIQHFFWLFLNVIGTICGLIWPDLLN